MAIKNPILDRYTENLSAGKLRWIGLRPERKAEMIQVTETRAIAELGLEGDRRCKGTPGSGRQVTLISQEHITAIASILGSDPIAPEVLRRNLVVSGINLMVLRHRRFRIGDAEFEATANCHPCRRMDDALGTGGFAAMYGHGGLCAKVLISGNIKIGDDVVKL